MLSIPWHGLNLFPAFSFYLWQARLRGQVGRVVLNAPRAGAGGASDLSAPFVACTCARGGWGTSRPTLGGARGGWGKVCGIAKRGGSCGGSGGSKCNAGGTY